jgi:hypothetical protein
MTRTLALFSLVILGCNAPLVDVSQEALIGSSKFASTSVVGALIYGNTSDAVSYTNTPTYRAFSFTGAAGDQADVQIASGDGDAIGWLIDSSYHIVAHNDDASDDTTNAHLTATLSSAGTYYIVFRELNLNNASLTVTLSCAGGACNPVCTPGQVRCDGVQPEVCSPVGQWVAEGPACPFACSNGNCIGQCVPGSLECIGNGIGTCDATGQWVVNQCPSGYTCQGDSCVCAPPSCGSFDCGVVSNACGTVSCGTCDVDERCVSHHCVLNCGGKICP